MTRSRKSDRLRSTLFILAGFTLLRCGSSSTTTQSTPVAQEGGAHLPDAGDAGYDANACFPDNDGINGGDDTFELTVDDTGFYGFGPDAGTKDLLSTQNDAQVTLTLKNTGTKAHGFKVGCANVTGSYPDLPAGCPSQACFPSNAEIAPLAPGASMTITFDTPTPDGIIYPFTSNEPADSDVPGLNQGQWSLM